MSVEKGAWVSPPPLGKLMWQSWADGPWPLGSTKAPGRVQHSCSCLYLGGPEMFLANLTCVPFHTAIS